MRESVIYQDILQKGEEKGRKEGEQRGRELGEQRTTGLWTKKLEKSSQQ